MAEKDSDAAVIEEVEEEVETKARPKEEQREKPTPAKGKPKRQPPYAVVVLNDDDHTYAYVIDVLQKTFGYDLEKCYLLALQIDLTGRAVVWTGTMEVAEFKRDRIRGFGPDVYAMKPVTFPLGCVIEPMPQ
jgi:ATP-dependent Clp protease adaptor protein ClpS